MAKKYGDPLFNVRLPPKVLDALTEHAKQKDKTASQLVRELIIMELIQHGKGMPVKKVDGQIRIEEVEKQ